VSPSCCSGKEMNHMYDVSYIIFILRGGPKKFSTSTKFILGNALIYKVMKRCSRRPFKYITAKHFKSQETLEISTLL
jgi:hypothetical protein